MDKIDNRYIDKAIDELISLIGIKKEISQNSLLNQLHAGNTNICIEHIAAYLGLPVAINLTYVPDNPESTYFNNHFDSHSLAVTDTYGRGKEYITAQVMIPSNIPKYGTDEMRNFPISVKVSNTCINYPFTFMAIMAHELSHIVLHSLRYQKKDNELYTDLTAMILGFSNVLGLGRKNTINSMNTPLSIAIKTTYTYGYLSDGNFNFALLKIKEILAENEADNKLLLKEIDKYGKLLNSYKLHIQNVSKLLDYIDHHSNKKFDTNDTLRLMQLHQPNYLNNLKDIAKRHIAELSSLSNQYTELSYFKPNGPLSLKNALAQLQLSITELSSNLFSVNNDINILRKYTNPIHKLRWH